jgi:Fe-S-cluster containining protein
MAKTGPSEGPVVTANLHLTIGDLSIALPVTMSRAPMPAAEIVPVLQGIVTAVVTASEKRSEAEGKPVSCRKGCAACCRQLIPVSRTEAERLLALVEALPADRRARVTRRFETASAALATVGLRDTLLDAGRRAGTSDRDLSTAYYALGIACPFLEEENCSIYAERPLVCREYLVTSPAELCSGPLQEGVTPVPVAKVSLAARGLEEDRAEVDTSGRWFPLALLMDWSKRRPRPARPRPGTEWVERFLKKLGRQTTG